MPQTDWRRSALAMPFMALGFLVTLAAQQAPRVTGETVDVEFVASAAGTDKVLCTEDCGRGHDDMVGTLVVKAVAQ